MLTFQFQQIPGSPTQVQHTMRDEITRVYRTHVTRVARYPDRGDPAKKLPIWMLMPDWPVAKAEKHLKHEVTINGGLHYAGIAAMPLVSRLKESLDEHFNANKEGYVRMPLPLLRVRADRIATTPERAFRYTFKSLERGRATSDDVFILPFALSEVGTCS